MDRRVKETLNDFYQGPLIEAAAAERKPPPAVRHQRALSLSSPEKDLFSQRSTPIKSYPVVFDIIANLEVRQTLFLQAEDANSPSRGGEIFRLFGDPVVGGACVEHQHGDTRATCLFVSGRRICWLGLGAGRHARLIAVFPPAVNVMTKLAHGPDLCYEGNDAHRHALRQ